MKSIFGYHRGFFKRFQRVEENSNNLKYGFLHIITGLSIFGILSLIVFSNVFAQESADEGEIRLWVQNYDFNTSMQVDLYNFKFEKIDSITALSPLIEFGNLDIGNRYFLILEYQSSIYSIGTSLTTPFKEVSIRLEVEEGVESNILIDFDHISINYDKENIIISEIIEFRNFGGRETSFVKVFLPDDYSDLDSDRCCIKIDRNEDSFYLSPIQIKPNETRTIELSYTLESSSEDYEYSRKAFYNTTGLLVIVNANNTRVVVTEDLIFRDIQKINEIIFEQYSASGINVDKETNLKISKFEKENLEQIWDYVEEFSLSIYRTFVINYLWIIMVTITFAVLGLFAYNFRIRTIAVSKYEAINRSMMTNSSSNESARFNSEKGGGSY
jgi:hypothetical protein